MTLRQFFNALQGFEEREEALARQRWELVQVIAYNVLLPHLDKKQKVTPADVLPLPWQKRQPRSDPRQARLQGLLMAKKTGMKLPPHLEKELQRLQEELT